MQNEICCERRVGRERGGYDDDDDDGFSGYLLSSRLQGELKPTEGLQLPPILANSNDLN